MHFRLQSPVHFCTQSPSRLSSLSETIIVFSCTPDEARKCVDFDGHVKDKMAEMLKLKEEYKGKKKLAKECLKKK